MDFGRLPIHPSKIAKISGICFDPPERMEFRPSGFKIFTDRSATRGEIGAAENLLKNRTQHCQNAEHVFTFYFLLFSLSPSLGFHYSSSSPTLHLSFPPLHSSPHILDTGFGILTPESSRKDGYFEASSRLIFRSSSKSNFKPTFLLFICER